MRTDTKLQSLLFTTLVLASCVAETGSESADLTEVTLAAGKSTDFGISLAEDSAVVLTVDCKPPKNPDVKGAILAIDSSALGVVSSELPLRAGYWQWAGELPAGEHAVTVRNAGSTSAKCKIGFSAAEPGGAEACTSRTVHRSPITHASHLAVGDTTSGTWEPLPASGNHWGAWAPWWTAYGRPVLRGFYLHNLEHGGLVLSYQCESSDESDACRLAEEQLIDLALTFGKQRLLITPDPTQQTMFALRSWRWAYASDCLDAESALEFMKAHYRQGREDIDADPPIPFDPTTTTDVPCQNLMAAPDGC